MKSNRNVVVIILIALMVSTHVNAKLSQPDFILYGTASWFGEPLAIGSEITLFLENQLLTVAKYSMGTDNNLSGLYALRIPMDDVDPRQHGKSRPGDPATVYINGNLVAEVIVGDYGTTERLDLDPINTIGSTPVISIMPAESHEGNSGSSVIEMQISLSETSNEEVSVHWTSLDATAFGQEACAFDVDYVNASGIATIQALTTSTSIQIEICGDTIIENNETFEVVLSQASNAIVQFDRNTATILDDDGSPELKGFDMVVFEPATGSLTQSFQFNLSRVYEQNVSFDFTTVANSATAGIDYIETSGQITILAGETQAFVPVNFLSDATSEGIEVLQLHVSNVVNAQIITTNLTGFIMDADREQQSQQHNTTNNSTIPDLISPSDVVISNDNQHVYVASLAADGGLLHFGFNSGILSHISTIKNTTTGFETAAMNLIRKIVISPNGNFLYAAASGNNAISVFAINSVSGELSFVTNLAESTAGEFGINNVYSILVSQDGNHLYATGSDSDSVAAFSINSTTGELSYIEAEVFGVNDPGDSGATVTFLDRPISLSLSPDGQFLYVTAEFSSSIVTFDRELSDGSLSFMQSLKSGVDGVTELGGASSVTTSNDGKHAYVTSRTDNSLVIFNRENDGTLSFNQALSKDVPDFIGLEAPNAIITNNADDRIYALGFDDSTMVTFSREKQLTSPDFGQLEFADIEQDEVNGITKLNGPTAIDITSDGRWIIVSAGIDNALTVFFTPLGEELFKDSFE